ncbi:GLUG motif-containing protein [Parabacteroides sp. PF5-6]|uniref:GLUG motif-containing protein n=1 Tax=Parabacteroides sp. PF5-6 TaxID=1742403 RepID=UPI002405EA81|nr:GLUG motif-containing protein [Parabacteroides sp. PF5-6]MDF9830819.1 hypothetical protein [Parabacteroides sp. PF5-6]
MNVKNMTQKLLFIAIAWMAISMQLSAQFAGGKGIEGDPFLIENASQLHQVREDLTAHYKLNSDIDLEEFLSPAGAGYNAGQGWEPIGKGWRTGFKGLFDGGAHKILNLWINRPGDENIGLFGAIDSGGGVLDLTLELAASEDQPAIRGEKYVGGLAGANYGEITACHVSGTLTAGIYLGGVVGSNAGRMTTTTFSGTVMSTDLYVGGLAGSNSFSISSCSAQGQVITNGESPIIGGLVGANGTNAEITHSYASTTVETDSNSARAGGLVGRNDGILTSCYATGAVTATGNHSYVGGLIGNDEENGVLTTCYATGAVTANGPSSSAGGLIGVSEGTISNCYSTGAVTAENKYCQVGGLIGFMSGMLTDSYSLSLVKGNAEAYVGGLVGVLYKQSNQPAPIPTGCFYFKEERTNKGLWGIATIKEIPVNHGVYTPFTDEAPGLSPLTAAEMTDKTHFADWDFSTVWTLYSEENSPSFIGQQENFPVPVVLPWFPNKGSDTDPYLIYTAEDLAALRYYLNEKGEDKYFSLEEDIDLEEFLSENGDGYNAGQGWAPIGPQSDNCFRGTFRGNGRTIRNLWINRPEENQIGLFGVIALEGKIEELTLELAVSADNAALTGKQYVGGLVGTNEGTITSCRVSGVLAAKKYIGGLAGTNEGTLLSGSFSGTVKAAGMYAGGLAGVNAGAMIACVAEGKVTADGIQPIIGGLAGSNEKESVITKSAATVTVETENVTAKAGGLIGRNYGTITSSYAMGPVTANGEDSMVGGLIGYDTGAVSSCYAMGAVAANGAGSSVGGLIGLSQGILSTCYATGTVTAEGTGSQVGGLIGFLDGKIRDSYSLSLVAGNADAGSSIGGLIGVLFENADQPVPAAGCFYLKQEGANKRLWGIAATMQIEEEGMADLYTLLTDEYAGVSPLNSSRMLSQKSFTHWNFENVWTIAGGQTAPYFPWQPEPYPVPAGEEEKENQVTHTITLVVDPAIACNYAAGLFTVAEGDHLFLQFAPEDLTRTATDLLLLIDGIETPFQASADGHGGSYILSPITRDHTIEIRLREDLEPVEPTDPTGTFTPEAAVRVYARDGRLTIETPHRVSAAVYALTGQCLHRQKVCGTATFACPAGVYVVRLGQTTYKVSIGR